jgi:energy-converting hydrogenase Eha subunit C
MKSMPFLLFVILIVVIGSTPIIIHNNPLEYNIKEVSTRILDSDDHHDGG